MFDYKAYNEDIIKQRGYIDDILRPECKGCVYSLCSVLTCIPPITKYSCRLDKCAYEK